MKAYGYPEQTIEDLVEMYIDHLDNQSPIVSTSHKTLIAIRELLPSDDFAHFEHLVDQQLKNRGY